MKSIRKNETFQKGSLVLYTNNQPTQKEKNDFGFDIKTHFFQEKYVFFLV